MDESARLRCSSPCNAVGRDQCVRRARVVLRVTAKELTLTWDLSPTTKFSIQPNHAAINTAEINGHIHL